MINSKSDVASSVLCPVLLAPDLLHPPAAVTALRTGTAECGLSGASVLVRVRVPESISLSS